MAQIQQKNHVFLYIMFICIIFNSCFLVVSYYQIYTTKTINCYVYEEYPIKPTTNKPKGYYKDSIRIKR